MLSFTKLFLLLLLSHLIFSIPLLPEPKALLPQISQTPELSPLSNTTTPPPLPQKRAWNPFRSFSDDYPFPIHERPIPKNTLIKYQSNNPSHPRQLHDTRQWRTWNLQNLPPSTNEFQIKSTLGVGGEGRVYEIVMGNDMQTYAAKTGLSIETEIRNMRLIESKLPERGHENILGIEYVVMLDLPRRHVTVPEFLVVDYCNRGDAEEMAIRRFNKRAPDQYQEVQLLDIMVQIARGVQALHDVSVYHLDIKPANILLTGAIRGMQLPKVLVKFADFTHAKTSATLVDNYGTRNYDSPERTNSRQTPFSAPQADIWSLGATFYELATGQVLYNEIFPSLLGMYLIPKYTADPQKWFQQRTFTDVTGRKEQKFSKGFVELLAGMLKPIAGSTVETQRFSIAEVLRRLEALRSIYARSWTKGFSRRPMSQVGVATWVAEGEGGEGRGG